MISGLIDNNPSAAIRSPAKVNTFAANLWVFFQIESLLNVQGFLIPKKSWSGLSVGNCL